MYKLKQALDSNNNIFYVICFNDIPDFYLSLYLKQKSINKTKTPKTYGEKLTFFLNYHYKQNINYSEIDLQSIQKFFLYLINFNSEDNFSNIPRVSYSTIITYKSAIIDFYKFYSAHKNDNILKLDTKRNLVKNNISWKEVQETIKITLNIYLKKYKLNNKEYIKEYTSEEIKAIYSQLNSLRNKSIFLLSLHGMRIDEILSITLDSYNGFLETVSPTRSKGKNSLDKQRSIVLNEQCIKVIENYILNERNIALQKVIYNSPYLFVNLKINKYDKKLTPLSYINFYNSFLSAAKRANISNYVRIHSGRSHRASELLDFMNNDKINFTDEYLRQIMGWNNIESSKPYIEHKNRKKALDISREIAKMKKKMF